MQRSPAMSKKLRIEELDVDSFEVATQPEGPRGTVRGHYTGVWTCLETCEVTCALTCWNTCGVSCDSCYETCNCA
jgi:hypothetical protein